MNVAKQSYRHLVPLLGAAAVVGSSGVGVVTSLEQAPKAVDLEEVRNTLIELIDDDAEQRGDGTSLAGTFVRLAWHCSGTYNAKDGTGGSNGAKMRFPPEKDYGSNAGLDVARAALEPVKQKYPELSYADLYTFSGVVAVENAGGPKIPFALGREDATDGSTSSQEDLLPEADKGSYKDTAQHVRDIFGRMGFTTQEIVALLGAHALGRCHTTRSGYSGPWTFAENAFSNEYFRLLLEERWSPKVSHNGKPWTGPDQLEDVTTGTLMMLPADMVLVHDPEFRHWAQVYASDEAAFFRDFALAFSKLLHNGVPNNPLASKPWYKLW